MIDVVFLLIIFFLVSSHLAQQENLIPLDLPSAASGLDELTDRETLVINILQDGTWMLGGASVLQPALETAMRRRMMDASQPVQLRIRTDRSVPYEKVEPILSTASKLGIGDIVFSVYGDRGQ